MKRRLIMAALASFIIGVAGCTTRHAHNNVIVERSALTDLSLENDTGQAVDGLRVQVPQNLELITITLMATPAHCSTLPQPASSVHATTATFTWTAACILPGDRLSLEIRQDLSFVAPPLSSFTWLQNGMPVGVP